MKPSIPAFQYKISLGQNFLFDQDLLNRLVDQTQVGEADIVLEIGAGRGDLTQVLAERCKQVVAVEIDERLEPVLKERFESAPNALIVMGDIMGLDISQQMGEYEGFHVIANLPYYLTTPILTMLFHLNLPIKSVNVMVQQEAAQRVLAQPGTPEYGPLAVLAAFRGSPKSTVVVPAHMFTPPPKVDSVFLVVPFYEKPPVQVDNEDLFFKVIRAAFFMRRKTLANNLVSAFGMPREEATRLILACGLNERVRGERLTILDFARLSNETNRVIMK
ncbi:MAG: ribosomal RNA small subunit methyltransferase A [Clostridiales bacterium]|nr:ribosomal RNA small subunit methyltransferase A [Clostridiales bacterium]